MDTAIEADLDTLLVLTGSTRPGHVARYPYRPGRVLGSSSDVIDPIHRHEARMRRTVSSSGQQQEEAVVPVSMPAVLAAGRFEAFGPSHQVALVLLVGGVVAILLFGRRQRGTALAERVGRGLAVAVLAVTVPLQLLYFTPGYWDLDKTLPLQLCDLASGVAAYALWTRRPWAAALTYFWGLTLTSQAIITPDLSADFPDPIFVLFWAMHLLVVWAAVYLVWGLGLGPSWRSYRIALVVTTGWAVAMFAFNVAVDTNYGYLNAKPEAASALDLLGPWPWYLLAEVVIVSAFWALITLPWASRAEAAGHRQYAGAPRPGTRAGAQ